MKASFSHEQIWIVLLLSAVVVVGAATSWRHRSDLLRIPRHIALAVAAATAVAFLLPVFATAPAFVHISMHGPLVLESVLAFPSADVHRSEFGQGGFVVLGLIAAVVGRTAEVVMASNAFFSAATTPLVAYLAARWARRDSAALYAAAAWSTSPLIARLAHSEDFTVIAVFFATLALTFAELAAASAASLPLLGAVLATMLAIWTRQTAYFSALLVVGVLVERRYVAAGRSERVVPLLPFVLTLCAILAGLGFRVITTLGESGDAMLLPVLALLARHPAIALADVWRHPFLSPLDLSLLVPTLGFVGMFRLARSGPIRFSFVLTMAALFVVSLPASFRSPGVAWSFRLPLYALALVAVGVGGAMIEQALEQRRGRPFSHGGLVAGGALCAALGLLARATAENRAPNAEFVEYAFIRNTLSTWPGPFSVASVHLEEPTGELPGVMARRLGMVGLTFESKDKILPTGPWIFFDGLACHGHSMPKLFEGTLGGPPRDEDIERFEVAMFDPREGFATTLVTRPTGTRAPCEEMEHRAESRSDGPVVHVDDDPPMVIFDAPEVPLRIFTGTIAEPPSPTVSP